MLQRPHAELGPYAEVGHNADVANVHDAHLGTRTQSWAGPDKEGGA